MSDGDGVYLRRGETISDIINERRTTTDEKRLTRIDNILDEYIREVTTKMKTSTFAKLRQDVTKRGRSTFAKFRNPDYKVRNAREAVFEVVSFIEDFKKGRLSESYRVQVEAAKTKKGLAGEVRGGMQESVTKGGETIEQAINNLVRNADGSLMTKEEYDILLDEGVQTKRRRDKKTKEWVITKQPHPANLLTSDPSLPGNDWLNGSIRNLGTRMEGGYISLVKGERDSMNDFMQAVKDKLTTAITNYNPETKYQGAAEGDLSGWLAQTIIYKKPGVIDDFRKLQETRRAAKEGGEYKGDDIVDVGTVEGTVVFARKLGFTEDVIGQDENGNNITRNVFDLIVEKEFNKILAADPKTYKDTKGLIKAEDAILVEILNIVAKEFGVKPSKLINDTALTTDERTSIQLKINSIGARSMLNMMPEGFSSMGDATGIPPVFLDGKKGKAINSETGKTDLIYTAQEERLKTVKERVGNKIVYGKPKKAGGGKGLKVQKKNFVDNINEADYLDMHGITPVGTERRFRTEDRVVDVPLRGSVMQAVIVIANQSTRKLANEKNVIGLQSIADGKGDLMLSSTLENNDNFGIEVIKKAYNYSLGDLSAIFEIGLTPLMQFQKAESDKVYKSQRDLDATFPYSTRTYKEQGTIVINDFLKMHPEFRNLIQMTMTGGVRAGFFQTVVEFDNVINKSDVPQRTKSRYSYSKTGSLLNPKVIEEINKKGFKEDQAERLPLLYDFFKAVEGYLSIDANKQNVWMFEEMLKDTGKSQNTITRILAPFSFYPIDAKGNAITNKKIVEEHTDPQNQVGKGLLYAALHGEVDMMWKTIGQSYMQGALLKIHDPSGELTTAMPDSYYQFTVPLLRNGKLKLPNGLASVIRLTEAGVDLNVYTLKPMGIDQTIAEFFGVNTNEKITSEIVNLQNEIITEVLTGKIKQEQASQEFGNRLKLTKATPSKVEVSKAKTLDRAIQQSRAINHNTKRKGMSAWDFDDTLATTKSGVKLLILIYL